MQTSTPTDTTRRSAYMTSMMSDGSDQVGTNPCNSEYSFVVVVVVVVVVFVFIAAIVSIQLHL